MAVGLVEHHSQRWVEQHIFSFVCQTLTWLDIFEDEDSHLDKPNIYCRICPKAHFHWHHPYIMLRSNVWCLVLYNIMCVISIAKYLQKLCICWPIKILTMLLAASNILWPVTSMCVLIVEKPSNAKLFSCSSIPASPIPCARSFVTKYSVQPIAMFGTNRRIWNVGSVILKRYIFPLALNAIFWAMISIHFYLRSHLPFVLRQPLTIFNFFSSNILTCQIFISANSWISPRVITPISNTTVFTHPN